MKDVTARISLQGVMDLVQRSKYPLAPLYEAVTNALEAISQKYQTYGKTNDGLIQVNFYFVGLLKEANDLDKIEIIDNGIGFNEENYGRFETLLDKSKGYNNRGSGRIQ